MSSTTKIEIVPYQEIWPQRFQVVSSCLRDCLGELFVSIDHIGSTSVPGLASKNRIDVQITIPRLDESYKNSLDQALSSGGFQKSRWSEDHQPPGELLPPEQWIKLYVTGVHPDLDFRSNIHIRVNGRANQIYPILFRDYLRKHPDAALAYQRFKEELVRYQMDDVAAYSEIKDPVCDLIMVSARKWAEQTQWAPQLNGR